MKLQIDQGREVLRQIVEDGRQINANKAPLDGALGVSPSVVVKNWLGFDSVAGDGAAQLWFQKCQVPGYDSGHAITINSRLPLRRRPVLLVGLEC